MTQRVYVCIPSSLAIRRGQSWLLPPICLSLEYLSAYFTISGPRRFYVFVPEKAEADVDQVVRHHCLLPKHHCRESSYAVGVQTRAHLIRRSHCHDRLRSSCSSGPRQPQAPFLLDLISLLSPVSLLPEDTPDPQTPKYTVLKAWMLGFLGIWFLG